MADLISIGQFKAINVKKTIDAGGEEEFKFTIPAGSVGTIRETTGKLVPKSDEVEVTEMKFTRAGVSLEVDLSDGTPNFDEVFGKEAGLPKLFTLIERAKSNSDIKTKIQNNDTIPIKVSATIWVGLEPE